MLHFSPDVDIIALLPSAQLLQCLGFGVKDGAEEESNAHAERFAQPGQAGLL